MKSPFDLQVELVHRDIPPEHHISPPHLPASAWASSYLGWWQQRQEKAKATGAAKDNVAGFRNPWPSFHKATKQELWRALEWGEDSESTIELAASHLPATTTTATTTTAMTTTTRSTAATSSARSKQAAQLLRSEKPNFAFPNHGDPAGVRTKTTWLGHAGMLVQLSPLKQGGNPIRVVFDPIFSHRSSPYQNVGPVRSYPPPCQPEDLPPIDILAISHNHFDHLDYDTVMALWRLNGPSMRVVVPLNNAKWFVDVCGLPKTAITELDWWDSAYLSAEGAASKAQGGHLRITCTPAQHSSVRDGRDADLALWAGWYLTHKPEASINNSDASPEDDHKHYRIFFAGDSGYQFHADPAWPPRPPPGTTHEHLSQGGTKRVADPDNVSSEKLPPCPAYREIAARLGTPDLIYLPVALGATWAYIRSFFSNYVPAAAVPVPRHSAGVTGAIHMPPWDAVRVLRELTNPAASSQGDRPPVAIAMHWGTFVTEPVEILKTLGQLEWACYNQGVGFGRSLEEARALAGQGQPLFLALDHGQSVLT